MEVDPSLAKVPLKFNELNIVESGLFSLVK